MIRITNKNLTKHFTVREMVQGNQEDWQEEVIINKEVMDFIKMMDEFREWYNRSISPNSWYRPSRYNDVILPQRGVATSSTSMHKDARAIDFSLPHEFNSFSSSRKEEFLNNVKTKWLAICKEYGYAGGIGFYDTFIHLDNRDKHNKGKKLNCGDHQHWDFRKVR